jgi:hypothetical protein
MPRDGRKRSETDIVASGVELGFVAVAAGS